MSRISGVTPYRCEDCDERSFGPRGAPASSRRSRRLSLAEQMQRLETRSQVPRWMLILAALVTAAAVLAALMYAEAPERQGWQESAKPD